MGLIHIYFGDGKGKTTAAMGLCARMAGCEKKTRSATAVMPRRSDVDMVNKYYLRIALTVITSPSALKKLTR